MTIFLINNFTLEDFCRKKVPQGISFFLNYKGYEYYLKCNRENGDMYYTLEIDGHSDIVDLYHYHFDALLALILAHFKYDIPYCIYPAKSFFVTLIYGIGYAIHNSRIGFHLTKDSIQKSLQKVRFNDLPYFRPYDSEYKRLYDTVLDKINVSNWCTGTAPATFNYFLDEIGGGNKIG